MDTISETLNTILRVGKYENTHKLKGTGNTICELIIIIQIPRIAF